jgi:hypothetical protein
MEIRNIFFEMLQYPNSPKVYRQLRDAYKEIGKTYESQAFSHLLEVRYKELNNDNDTSSNKK